MEPTPGPYDYSTERLLYAKARENAELRQLLAAVAGDLERLACSHPEHAERFLARPQQLRQRLHEAGGRD
jgi:hypothetical protein